MKRLILVLFVAIISNNALAQDADSRYDNSFSLSYISIGFGSNRWTMQPIFKVKGSQFIYTLEEVWRLDDSVDPKVDTLLIGRLRDSSIDSIMKIIAEVKGKVVYKLNNKVLSGGTIELSVSNGSRKIRFELHNANDSAAQKIVDILNVYIPNEFRKLWISDVRPEIIEIR